MGLDFVGGDVLITRDGDVLITRDEVAGDIGEVSSAAIFLGRFSCSSSLGSKYCLRPSRTIGGGDGKRRLETGLFVRFTIDVSLTDSSAESIVVVVVGGA